MIKGLEVNIGCTAPVPLWLNDSILDLTSQFWVEVHNITDLLTSTGPSQLPSPP